MRNEAASRPDAGAEAAAAALATHLRRWATAAATAAPAAPSAPSAPATASALPAADIEAVAAAGQALVLARGRGHVCLTGGALAAALPALRRSPLVAVARSGAAPPGLQPLVLAEDADTPRLYLRRDHLLEHALACQLARRAAAGRLRLLSGGPGSGKTTRVAALIHERQQARPGLRIALAAPTGKAAARMNEALAGSAAGPIAAVASASASASGLQATTVHRLLGVRAGLAGGFHHDAGHPLALDLLIVDEASMLDLELASALLAALPPQAELLLVGDADQLAAVEAGAVFAQLCAFDWPADMVPLHEHLSGSQRYASDSLIAALAQALRHGDAEAARRAGQALVAPHPPAAPVSPAATQPPSGAAMPPLESVLATAFASYAELLRRGTAGPAELLAGLRSVLVLTARHEGRYGTLALNRRIARLLRQGTADDGGSGGDTEQAWPGLAVIVLRNDPAAGLANGDVGIVWPRSDAAGGGWEVWFAATEQPRAVAFERLPAHATAFALTVHKAQGSEAEKVVVLLPPPEQARREWLYTAITRARGELVLVGELEALAEASRRPEPRDSGLTQRLLAALASRPSPRE